MVEPSWLLYSSGVSGHDATAAPVEGSPPPPWEVARDLRWRAVRGIVLDPIAMLGTTIAAWALWRTEVVGTAAALLLLAALATRLGDDLLFRRPDGDLLRVQPLGPSGFLKVRRAELGWWLHPARLLVAAAALSDGPLTAVAAWLAGGFAAPLGLWLALALRRLGPRGPLLAWLPAAAALATTVPGGWPIAVGFAAVAGLAGVTLEGAYGARFDQLASDAVTAPRRGRRHTWRLLEALMAGLPRPVRSRLVRDAVLTLRGQDGQGLILLLLSPLSCMVLVDELASLPNRAALTWRVLTAAALGGAAVAYAVGPGIHRLRVSAMAWERVTPHPGRRAMAAAMFWGLGLALVHGAATLATVGLVQDGRFAADVPGLVLPVLGLQTAMAHYVVAFTFSGQAGRRIAGEGTLVLSLPVVAIAVAVAGLLMPPVILAYFVVTAGMVAAGAARYDRVEVTW